MKLAYLILTAAFITLPLHAEFKTWTRSDGNTARLNLVGKTGEGADLKASFRMLNGQLVTFPVSDLIESDAKLVEAWMPPQAEVLHLFDEVLDGNLLKLDGSSLKSYELDKKPTKYYLFYYTASWCGPCKRFTPSLVKFYDQYKAVSDEFEIVLISSDDSKKSMEVYSKSTKMNWPQLNHSKIKSFKKKFSHPGGGIPNLVLTDLEGNILKSSYDGTKYIGPTVVMNHLETLIK